MFEKWTIAFVKSLVFDFLNMAVRAILSLFKWKKVEKKDDELVKKNEESSASNKPHEEKVKDAKDFLNSIGKP